MDAVAALYRELDPLRPLAADDDALYVDWQHQLDPGTADVKSRLVRAFVRNATPQRPITRLLTGHKGSGKTTKLNRVASALHSGHRFCGSRLESIELGADPLTFSFALNDDAHSAAGTLADAARLYRLLGAKTSPKKHSASPPTPSRSTDPQGTGSAYSAAAWSPLWQ